MDKKAFQNRTKQLALRIIKLAEALPPGRTGDIIGRQIVRSATSVGANYRAACRAKSPADFLNKLKIVEEEADETLYWLELIVEAELLSETRLSEIISETNEIVAMTVAAIKTQKRKQK
ncbi:MAG: four helix bundle protein [Anaerolineales bacterium]|nr:four helix bundle protein [Anaerolineales bacterium]MCB8960961.1 four helix bundle protein [Ardenticatenales bacterium]